MYKSKKKNSFGETKVAEGCLKYGTIYLKLKKILMYIMNSYVYNEHVYM